MLIKLCYIFNASAQSKRYPQHPNGGISRRLQSSTIGRLPDYLDLWTRAALTSLLYNCSTWLIKENRINNCQDFLLQAAFRTGIGCATVALRSECGLVSPPLLVWEEKVKLVLHIRSLELGSLARRVYEEHKKKSLPGLDAKVTTIYESLVIEDTNNTEQDKRRNTMKLKEAWPNF